MFAKGKAIREAKKAEILAKATQEGLERGMQAGLERGMQAGLEQGMQQGLEQGMQQGVMQERKRSNANLRAWAKEHGIPEDDLPFMDEDA